MLQNLLFPLQSFVNLIVVSDERTYCASTATCREIVAPTSLKQFLPFDLLFPPTATTQNLYILSVVGGSELTSVVGDRKLVSFVTLKSIRFSSFCFCHEFVSCFSFIPKSLLLFIHYDLPPTSNVNAEELLLYYY